MANTYLCNYEGSGGPGEIICGIHNTTTDKVAKIYRASCVPKAFVVGTMSLWMLYKASAISGGESPPANRIMKWDSTSPNLPTQVDIKFNCSYTAGNQITPKVPGVQTFGYSATYRLFATMYGQASAGADMSTMRRYATFDSGVQNLTLREGEGMVFAQNAGSAISYCRDFEITIKVGTNFYTIAAFDRTPLDYGDAMIGIFNGAGSGVVVEVVAANFFLTSTVHTSPYAFGKFNKKVDIGQPVTLTANKMDSTNPDLPAGIKCYSHVVFEPWPEKHGISNAPYIASSIAYDPLQMYAYQNTFLRFIPSARGKAAGLAMGLLDGLLESPVGLPHIDAYGTNCPIEVNQNDCVGYYIPAYFGWSSGMRYSFTLEFTVEDAVSDYPVEDDVEFGVVYGPGDVYEGDFVSPAQADVKLAVGYGADGTEFTGTYAPGGGNPYPIFSGKHVIQVEGDE